MKDIKIKLFLKKKLRNSQKLNNTDIENLFFKSIFIPYNIKYIYNFQISSFIFNNFYKTYSSYYNYIYEIELLYDSNIKGKFLFKYKFLYINSIITFLIKNGKKLKIYNNFIRCLSDIYIIFNDNNTSVLNNYISSEQFYLFLQKTENKYNLNFLLHWLICNYKPTFDIKCHSVNNKIKKKIKKKYKYKLVYIPEKIRIKISLRHIAAAVKKNEMGCLYFRLNNVILDTLLNYKKSYIHLRKIYIYSKVFKI